MAKLKRRNKSKLFSPSHKRSKGKARRDVQGTLINSGIAVLSLLLIAFIFSFGNRQTRSGVPIEVRFPSLPDSTKLATEVYEKNPVLEIDVEVLNGCGEPGLASKFSNYLRSEQLDVVRSDNADHFDYTATFLIQRNENVEGMKLVAEALGFDVSNPSQVKVETDANLDVDVTLIIGKDYASIKSFDKFLNN